ncbi:MAG TPA: FAD-dependent oxidoreductase, partial [Bryobacterales bacterium]|nr:FAD-dependent oxidoreductase [Bryobacterales bacterium]
MQSSIWFQTLAQDQRLLLEASDALPKTAEVAIVGSGMSGLAIAYYLLASGVSSICLLDRDTAVGEASGANAGGLWFAQQSAELGPLTPLAKASSRLYDELAAQPGWNFDLRRTGLLELLARKQDFPEAAGRVEAVRSAGFRAERIGGPELRRLEPALGLHGGPAGAIFYPDEGQLHPAKLGAALVRHLKANHVRFSFHTEVARIGASRLETSRGPLDAGTVVITAGSWTPLVTRTLGWTPPIKPMRGQLLATPPRPPFLHHTIIGEHFYYWQLTEGHVAGGGTVEDVGFERGTNPADLARIRAEMDTLFPELRAAP